MAETLVAVLLYQATGSKMLVRKGIRMKSFLVNRPSLETFHTSGIDTVPALKARHFTISSTFNRAIIPYDLRRQVSRKTFTVCC